MCEMIMYENDATHMTIILQYCQEIVVDKIIFLVEKYPFYDRFQMIKIFTVKTNKMTNFS